MKMMSNDQGGTGQSGEIVCNNLGRRAGEQGQVLICVLGEAVLTKLTNRKHISDLKKQFSQSTHVSDKNTLF